jgi:hypothetical protein
MSSDLLYHDLPLEQRPNCVWLNVYNVGQATAIYNMNRLTAPDPLPLGGVFHGGLQIYDLEWSFGMTEGSDTGVHSCLPRCHRQHRFRESVCLGLTPLTKGQVNDVIVQMIEDWPGDSYDVLSRNCCTFCTELAFRLGVERPPAWVDRFARAGAALVKIAGSIRRGIFGQRSNSLKALPLDPPLHQARRSTSGGG